MDSLYKRLAATYFSTNKCSIIGVKGLNFSVRNGKRCGMPAELDEATELHSHQKSRRNNRAIVPRIIARI